MEGITLLLSIIGWLCIGGFVGGLIGSRIGNISSGVISGMLLGPIGWLILLFEEDTRPRCKACRSVVDPLATICPCCQTKRSPVREVRQGPVGGLKYIYWNGEVEMGPYGMEQILHMPPNTKTRLDGSDEWHLLGSFSEYHSGEPQPAEEKYFYLQNGEVNGPLYLETLLLMVSSGQLSAETQVCTGRGKSWVPISTFLH